MYFMSLNYTLKRVNFVNFSSRWQNRRLCSSPPVIAPKSQPSTGGRWNPSKKGTVHPKTKKKPQQDSRRGTIMIKSNPYPPVGWPINWTTIIKKKFSHCCEGSESHIRLPSLGIHKGTGNPQGIWPGRPVGFDYKISTGLGETDSSLGWHKQNLACTKTQRKGAVTPQEAEAKPPASVGGSLVEAWVSRRSPQGWGYWQ